MNKLILFDIDGTLVKGKNKAHRKSYSVATKKVFGVNVDINEIQTSGKTDTRILIELLNKKGMDTKEVKPKMKQIFKLMVEYVKRNIENSNLYAIPNAKKLLKKLKNKGYILGLLTGNLEEIAKLKLRKVGLLKFFQVGGFGEISEIREKLLKHVIRETERNFEVKIYKKDIFYIGDAPLDIECGRNVGVRTIAVATGIHTKEELMKYKPDYLFEDFSDLKRMMDIIECQK